MGLEFSNRHSPSFAASPELQPRVEAVEAVGSVTSPRVTAQVGQC